MNGYKSLDDFTVDIRLRIPASQYRKLVALAGRHEKAEVTVEAIVREIVRRALLPERKATAGRVSNLTPERERVIVEMHAAKAPDSAIAKALGCDRTTVGDYRARLGLPTLYRGRPKRRVQS